MRIKKFSRILAAFSILCALLAGLYTNFLKTEKSESKPAVMVYKISWEEREIENKYDR